MNNFLETILKQKEIEVANMEEEKIGKLKQAPKLYDRLKSQEQSMQIIAELKRASPSKGDIRTEVDVIGQAIKYQAAEVAAISVLTDEIYFKGSMADLKKVATVVEIPVLCKDFIIDKKQLIRARNSGATVVLLIVAALDENKLHELFKYAHHLSLEVLVETHNLEELSIAEKLGAKLIGVNNRNLETFDVDIAVSQQLAKHHQRQNEAVYISESGIRTRVDVERVQKNYHAVLVGETLMRAENPTSVAKELKVPRI